MIGKAHSKFCWHEKSSIHIEAVSKLLENRNEKDIIKLFGQEDLKQEGSDSPETAKQH